MHVCMMHISMILDPDACMYLCSLILDTCMYDARMVHASMMRIFSVTNGRTNKALLGVGWAPMQKHHCQCAELALKNVPGVQQIRVQCKNVTGMSCDMRQQTTF